MWRKLLSLNTRYIYLAIVVVVVIPVILKVPLPTSPSEPTQKLFDHIDTLEAGDGIWFFLDTRPATKAIHRPQLHVLLHHCFSKGIKVVGFNPLAPEATGMGRPIIEEIATQYGNGKNNTDFRKLLKRSKRMYCFAAKKACRQPRGQAGNDGKHNDNGDRNPEPDGEERYQQSQNG